VPGGAAEVEIEHLGDAFRRRYEAFLGRFRSWGGAEATEGFLKCQTCLTGAVFLDVPGRILRFPLTVSRRGDYLSKLVFRRLRTMNLAGSNEADIQAAQPQADEQARVSGAHEDGGRTQDAEPPAQAGPSSHRREGGRQVAEDSSAGGERLPRDARIRLGSEIRDLLERGKRKRTPNLDVFFAASPASRSRLGLIVPKHGHRVVDRNKLKRRLREIGRRQVLPGLEEIGVRGDVLIRARRVAYAADFERLAGEVREAVEGLCSEDC
jgi:ribonuclease P protein component